MKFKTIFVLFNVLLVFSFAFIFFMPFFLLGTEFLSTFWLKNWPLFTFFALVLIGFNAFFASQWRLFTLLEAEDWAGLADLLKVRVLDKGRSDRRTVRLFINTSLLRGDVASIERLESVLRERRPAALRRDALLFGAARLLKGDAPSSLAFLSEFVDAKGCDNPEWLGFYYAFALVMDKRAAEAAPRLEKALGSKDPVLALMAAYTLGSLCAPAANPEEKARLSSLADSTRITLAGRFGAMAVSGAAKGTERWSREIERAKGEVHIVILSKILDEAGAWLFGAKEPSVQ